MTTAVQTELLPTLSAYRTGEFATLTRSGAPIAWPMSVLAAEDGSSLLVTSSLGFPQKALHIRRDPRVALLFSDPTGSGATSLPQVLVQGTAVCPDEVVISPKGYERYWCRLWEIQPRGELFDTTPVTRWLMDWYYMRLPITVTPTRVLTRPPLDIARNLPAPADPGGVDDAYARFVRQLPTFHSAVLASLDEQGAPVLRRVRPTADPAARGLVLDPGDEPLQPGSASLLCHSHDARLWNLRSMVAVGELQPRSGTWMFSPTRFVPGAGTGPVTLIRMIRQNRRAAKAYLGRRGLRRPEIPWSEYRAVKRARSTSLTRGSP